MLTRRDRAVQQETGMVPPDRLRALRHALLAQATDAKRAAADLDADSQAAAALRGKKIAYREAALMVQHILDGQALHPRSYSTATRLQREWSQRRSAARCEKTAR